MGKDKPTQLPKLFLVNLDRDISEQHNLAKSNLNKLNELQKLYDEWLKSILNEKSK